MIDDRPVDQESPAHASGTAPMDAPAQQAQLAPAAEHQDEPDSLDDESEVTKPKQSVVAEGDYKYLWEEYKLLQDKIDRFGVFRFQVKGWLIPMVSAWVVAMYTAHISRLSLLFAALFPLVFWLLEYNHYVHQKAFIRRISTLENILREKAGSIFFGPLPRPQREWIKKRMSPPAGTHQLTPKTDQYKKTKKTRVRRYNEYLHNNPTSAVHAINSTNDALKETCRGKIILRAHGIFYLSISFSVILLTITALCTDRVQDDRTAHQPDFIQAKPSGQPGFIQEKFSGQQDLIQAKPDLIQAKPSGQQDLIQAKPSGQQDLIQAKPSGQQDLIQAKPSGQPDLLPLSLQQEHRPVVIGRPDPNSPAPGRRDVSKDQPGHSARSPRTPKKQTQDKEQSTRKIGEM